MKTVISAPNGVTFEVETEELLIPVSSPVRGSSSVIGEMLGTLNATPYRDHPRGHVRFDNLVWVTGEDGKVHGEFRLQTRTQPWDMIVSPDGEWKRFTFRDKPPYGYTEFNGIIPS